MKNVCIKLILLFFVTMDLQAMPKIRIEHGHSLDGFARVKIKNEINKDLACYVAIDGHKIKFVLPAQAFSKWYTATDTRYNHTNFSTWCDHIDLHDNYLQYRAN